MKDFLKRLFCKHKNSEVVCWHEVRDYDMFWIAIQFKCNDCGKYYFDYIMGDDKNKCERFMKEYADKRYSEDCKMVIEK